MDYTRWLKSASFTLQDGILLIPTILRQLKEMVQATISNLYPCINEDEESIDKKFIYPSSIQCSSTKISKVKLLLLLSSLFINVYNTLDYQQNHLPGSL